LSRELGALDYIYNVSSIISPFDPEDIPGRPTVRATPALLSPASPYRQAVINYFTNGQWSVPLQIAVSRRCHVARLKYGSPGFQDLTGVGKALEVIADLVKYFLEMKQRREAHDVTMRTKALEHERMAIENERARLAFMKEARFSQKEIRKATQMWSDQQELLWSLVEQKKITGVEDPK